MLLTNSQDIGDKTSRKLKKSNNAEEKVFYKLFQITDIKLTKTKVLNIPFLEEKIRTQQEDMLKTVGGAMQFFHADVPDLSLVSL